jgi:phosphatidylglycerol:prolipoprotein diacylglycerol transferase
MLPILQIGPLALQTAGLILLIGLWMGLTLAEKLAAHFHSNPQQIYSLIFIVLIGGIIGARLSYIVQYFDAFRTNPVGIFSLNPGLLDPLGGGLSGIILGAIYGKRKNLALWQTLDALSPLMAVMGVALGLSHLASGDAFGAATMYPWGIELWGMTRHPSQIYETLLATLILWIIWRSATKPDLRLSGETFFIYLASSAAARLFLEAFRGDSRLLPNGLRVAQIAAWFLLAGSLWRLGWLYKHEHKRAITTEIGEGIE